MEEDNGERGWGVEFRAENRRQVSGARGRWLQEERSARPNPNTSGGGGTRLGATTYDYRGNDFGDNNYGANQ